MFKLIVMIGMMFLQCVTGKIVPANTSEANNRPTQPSIIYRFGQAYKRSPPFFCLLLLLLFFLLALVNL